MVPALPAVILLLPLLALLGAVSAGPPQPRPCVPGPGTATVPAVPMEETPVREVRLAHANLYTGMSPAQFATDLAAVIAGEPDPPDVVTLNETYTRTRGQLTPAGYEVWRAENPRDARETPVLWRTDTWTPVATGTTLLHDRPVKWGTRYLNWVTLKATDGTRLSVVSAHASPGGPGRDGLLAEFLDQLARVVATLRASGPVLVGADLNLHYPTAGRLTSRLTLAGLRSTHDALGEPAGGWATGAHGATLDYVLLAGATPVSHATADLPHSDHRLLTATVALTETGCAGGTVPPACPATGGAAEAGLTLDALRVMRCVLTVFGPHAVAGVGERPNASDHPSGRAVDVMIATWDTPAGNSEGWRIARWAQANAETLHVTYVIFDARIWSVDRADEGWRSYRHPTGASTPTLDHLDHVHLSVIGAAATSQTSTEAVAP